MSTIFVFVSECPLLVNSDTNLGAVEKPADLNDDLVAKNILDGPVCQ